MYTKVKTDQEIKSMRQSGQILASVFEVLEAKVTAGMTGEDVAQIAAKEVKALGGKASILGYQGFPKVICVSVNDEVVHGIPNEVEFKDGDIVSFDFCVSYKGMITDSAFSMIIGKSDDKQKADLLKFTEASLYAGIDVIKGPTHIGDISAAVQFVLDQHGYGIVRDLVGHGVGHQMHEEPNIPNYGTKGKGDLLKPGMTIAIEPMATLGEYGIKVDDDKWTIRTKDGSLSAHFEHTVLITEDGYEILTRR